MRGDDPQTEHLFSYLSPEQRILADHPVRAIGTMTDAARELSRQFEGLYATIGRPSVPPEKLLRELLLQVLYSVRSERLLMEELQYNLLFRWLVGLNIDDTAWTATTFSNNRERLLTGDIAAAFFDAIRRQARVAGMLSDEHFTVDGTLLEAWAGQKSFKRRDTPPDDPGNADVTFRGGRRRNDTHASTTAPDAQLYRKSGRQEAKLAYLGHVLLDNRHGLMATCVRPPPRARLNATQELRCLQLCDRGPRPGDHAARRPEDRPGAIDARTTRHDGYAVSQRKRKPIEQAFGWMKTIGLLRKLRHRGGELVDWVVTSTATAFNLTRMRTLRATCLS